jgi:hypothetical protein
MGMITIEVRDATDSKREVVELPDDEPVNRILVKLVEIMNLPTHHPTGQMIVHKFHHGTVGQLRDEQTLTSAGIRNGEVLRIYAEITAGGVDL